MPMTYGEMWSGLGMFILAKRSVILLRVGVIRVILLLSAIFWEHMEKKEPYSSERCTAIGQAAQTS